MISRVLSLSSRCSIFILIAVLLGFLGRAAAQDDAATNWQRAQDALSGGDQCNYQQFACKAAQLDSKNKEYKKGCNQARSSVASADRDALKNAREQFNDKKYDTASRLARGVCKADGKFAGDAASLIEKIQVAQSGSSGSSGNGPHGVETAGTGKADAALWEKAQANFANNDFAQAVSAAKQITDPDLKPQAAALMSRVSNYTQALQEGSTAEQKKDLQAAERAYGVAAKIKPDGPGNPAARILSLDKQIAAQAQHTQPPNPHTGPDMSNGGTQPIKPPADDQNAKIARLLAEAHAQESANNLQGALKAYEAVQHLQPNNADAAGGRTRVETAINRDPAEQAKTLQQAIRDFYSAKYPDSEDELTTYLASTTAKSKGAAYFYLGATRLYRSVLEGSRKPAQAVVSEDVQRPFKYAKDAGYHPLPQFVSPLLMKAWQGQ